MVTIQFSLVKHVIVMIMNNVQNIMLCVRGHQALLTCTLVSICMQAIQLHTQAVPAELQWLNMCVQPEVL